MRSGMLPVLLTEFDLMLITILVVPIVLQTLCCIPLYEDAFGLRRRVCDVFCGMRSAMCLWHAAKRAALPGLRHAMSHLFPDSTLARQSEQVWSSKF